MTIFLCVIPRTEASKPHVEEAAQRAARLYGAHCGPRYSKDPIIRKPMSTTGAIMIEWITPEGSNAIRVSQAWSVSTEPTVSLRIIRSLTSDVGTLRLKNPVWGSFATVTGRYDSDRLFAWATVPGVEAIHYSSDAHAIYISNRPLAIASAQVKSSLYEVQLDEGYLLDYLSFGFSVSGRTPFEGIYTVPSDRAVSVYQGEFGIVPAPQQGPVQLERQSSEAATGADELLDSLRQATERGLAGLGNRPIQLRLSGGKDSRLVLALLLDAGVSDITAVTQGDANSQEVQVANALAGAAGVPHQIKYASLSVPTGVTDSVLQSIRDSQGMLLSEAIGMPYAFADPMHIGEGYAAGQWPTFKAPYVRRTAHSLEDLDTEWHAHIAENLSPDIYDRASGEMRKWVATISSTNNNDILYLYGRNIRAANYMHASSIAIDSYSKILYPFVDSQVTAVADALPNHARRSEISLFLAIKELWPEALSIPLARGGRFRFERSGPHEGVSGDDYALRTAEPKPIDIDVSNPDYLSQADDRELLESPLNQGAKQVLGASSWDYLKRFLAPSFITRMESIANAGSEGEVLKLLRTRRGRIMTKVWIWRLISADAWLSKRWLPSDPSSQHSSPAAS